MNDNKNVLRVTFTDADGEIITSAVAVSYDGQPSHPHDERDRNIDIAMAVCREATDRRLAFKANGTEKVDAKRTWWVESPPYLHGSA